MRAGMSGSAAGLLAAAGRARPNACLILGLGLALHAASAAAASAEGYCQASYAHSGGRRSCDEDDKGSFDDRRMEHVRSWEEAEAACAAECERCARCVYISYSYEWKTCSWFHECDLRQLSRAMGKGSHRSAKVREPTGGSSADADPQQEDGGLLGATRSLELATRLSLSLSPPSRLPSQPCRPARATYKLSAA